MKKSELIELYYSIEEAVEERRRLGEFDANSKHVILLLDGLRSLTSHAIENHSKLALLPTKMIKGKKK